MGSTRGLPTAGIGVAAALALSGIVPLGGSAAMAAAVATRYASPNGSGATCTANAPCNIYDAINNAPSGAEVVVLPGNYGSTIAPITEELYAGDGAQLTIHGLANKPAPVIVSSATYAVSASDSTVDHLRIVQVGDGGGLLLIDGAANHVVVDGGTPAACTVTGGSLFNSVCISDQSAAVKTIVATNSAASVFRNVTAIGTGADTDGFDCLAISSGGHCQQQVTNSIAWSSPGGSGLSAYATTGATAAISAFNDTVSAYSVEGEGASLNLDDNTTFDPPKFVNAASHNFHEAEGSPTIDAGLNAGADKTADADGLPRILGEAVDVGAYEFAPAPGIGGLKVTDRRKHSLQLSATVQTQKLPTLVRAIAHHGNTTVKGRKRILTASGKAKTVTLVVKHLKRHTSYDVKVSVAGLGGAESDSTTGTTR